MSKSESSSIEQHVSERIASCFSERPKFVVGVSGGADSMAILFVFKKLNVDALVVHINYGLRGEDSEKDQELVECMAFEWGFECCSVNVNSEEAKKENFQNWARKERYRIFSDLASESNAVGIAIAHHKNDQVETIFQKIFRGSSPEAWSGMLDWDGEKFRPLLPFSKDEILRYCEERAIPYRTDKSNLDSRYSRNFIRNEFSEQLNNLFPGWEENMLKLKDFGRLNNLAIKELLDNNINELGLSIEYLKNLEQTLAQAIIKKFLEKYNDSLSEGLIKEAYSLMKSQTGSELQLSDSVSLIRDREYLTIKEKKASFKEVQITKEMASEGFQTNELSLRISDFKDSDLYLDKDKVQFPIILRRWKDGDKIQPFGMKGSQKISDHLTNRKVSAVNKEKSLVLSDTDGTIYAIIFHRKQTKSGTISEICKITSTTKQYLLITPKKQA